MNGMGRVVLALACASLAACVAQTTEPHEPRDGDRDVANDDDGQEGDDDMPQDAGLRWVGRVDHANPTQPRFAWSGSGFRASFVGTGLSVRLANGDAFFFKAVVDGQPASSFQATAGEGTYVIASGLELGTHRVELYRQTEAQMGVSRLISVTVDDGELSAPPAPPDRLIEVIGDSITCGYGNLGASYACGFTYATESHWDTYAAIAARAVDAELHTIAISGRGMFRNNTGTTSGVLPSVYHQAILGDDDATWESERAPDVVLINLGTNDFTQGNPGDDFELAYLDFVMELRALYPQALLLCAVGPMVSDTYPAGAQHLTRLRGYVNGVIATRHEAGDTNIELLEFTTQSSEELGCDYHPNVAKHATMATALVARLSAKLGW